MNDPRRRRTARATAVALAGTAALALAGTAALALPVTPAGAASPAGGARRPAASTGKPPTATTTPAKGTSTGTPGSFRLLSTTPSGSGVAGTAPLVLRFSQPLSATTPLPQLSPSVPGTWARDAGELVYRPVGSFAPGNTYTVRLPGGRGGMRSSSGATLAQPAQLQFSTRGGTQAGAEAALAALDYLPATLVPATGGHLTAATASAATPATLAGAFYGAAAPRLAAAAWAPAPLRALLGGADGGVLLRGAVISFQRVHGLAMTGILDAPTWRALAAAAGDPAANQQPGGYTYALADQQQPETLTVYDNGHVVVHTLANTGIPQSPTANGSFLVYERLASQVMQGTNPWGTHYADPVSWVAYFNGGDAVHYIGRAAYGYPQSLGCIETPYTAAETAWPYLRLGTVVTVEG